MTIDWREAEARLRRAGMRADRRVPALAKPFCEWAAALRQVARRGGAHEVRLEMSTLWQMYDEADQMLSDLRAMMDLWHGEGAVAESVLREGHNAATGFNQATGIPFPASIPPWQPGRPVPGSRSTQRDRRQSLADWGMALLFAAGVIGGWALGRSYGGGAGGWIGGTIGLVASCLVTGIWVRGRMTERTDRRVPSPDP